VSDPPKRVAFDAPRRPRTTRTGTVFYRRADANDVEFVSESARNPFGMKPPCESAVPGYGDTNADFHVIGDHPGVHGGRASGIPFTDQPWSTVLFEALDRGGLVTVTDETLVTHRAFLSYLHMCDPGEGSPDDTAYAETEPFFDAELRAITAHVLFPVGRRATRHVLEQYTARSVGDATNMNALHAQELRGAGWLVMPIADPGEWNDGDAETLVEALQTLLESDYRQASDLGRFLAGDNPYFVR
jgi:uracil-DNA glycosylase